MDERVLGEVPSEGSESGRRFGIYREHNPDLKMRSVTRNLMLFVTLVAAIIAFSVSMNVFSVCDSNKNFTVMAKFISFVLGKPEVQSPLRTSMPSGLLYWSTE